MTISRKIWNAYISKLRAINDKAVADMWAWLDANGIENADAMIDYAFALSTKYGNASAAMAAEMYDAAVELSGLIYPAAVPAEPATIGEVAKAVVGTAKTGNVEIISGAVGRLVKMAGVDTTMQNALRDGAHDFGNLVNVSRSDLLDIQLISARPVDFLLDNRSS